MLNQLKFMLTGYPQVLAFAAQNLRCLARPARHLCRLQSLFRERIVTMNRDYRPSFQTIGRRFPLSQRERAGVRENCPNQNLHWFMESTQIETESISRSRIFWNGRKMSLLTELVFQHVHKTTSMPVLTDFISLHLCVNQSFKIKNLLQKIKTSSSNPIKGLLMEKIPNFFPGTFTGNHWQIPKKYPKKTSNCPKKPAIYERFSPMPIYQ